MNRTGWEWTLAEPCMGPTPLAGTPRKTETRVSFQGRSRYSGWNVRMLYRGIIRITQQNFVFAGKR